MRRGLILGVLAALLLTVGWWFLLISPRNAKIDEARQELQSARDEEALLRTRISNLEEIRDAEVEYLAALGNLETMIPDRPLLEEFIEQINALADSTGVLLRSMSPSIPASAPDNPDLREISVNVQLEGQFFDVVGFLFGLTESCSPLPTCFRCRTRATWNQVARSRAPTTAVRSRSRRATHPKETLRPRRPRS